MRRIKAGILYACLFFSAIIPTAAYADDEAQKQATRLISQAISQRLSRNVDVSSAEGEAGKQSAWGLGSYTDLGFSGKHSADVFLGTGGYDGSDEQYVYGVSGSYARVNFAKGSTFGVNNSTSSLNSFNLSPYGAVKLSPNVFLSGIASLAYSSFGKRDSTAVGTEVAINAFSKTDEVVVRGKLAYRGSTTLSDKSDWFSTLVVFAEAETKASDTVSLFANVEINRALIKNAKDTNQIYGGIGAFIRPDPGSTLGISYQRLFNGKSVDASTYTLQYRSVF